MSDTRDFEPRRDPRFARLQAELAEAFELLVLKYLQDGFDSTTAMDEGLGRFEAFIERAFDPIPKGERYIPPILECSFAEVSRWFGQSSRRQELLGRVRKWIELAIAVGAKRLLLDGSFVTAKADPRDVDAVILLPDDFGDKLDNDDPHAAELRQNLVTRQPPELFAAEDENDWWNWFEFFSRTRESTGRRKGLVEVRLR